MQVEGVETEQELRSRSTRFQSLRAAAMSKEGVDRAEYLERIRQDECRELARQLTQADAGELLWFRRGLIKRDLEAAEIVWR